MDDLIALTETDFEKLRRDHIRLNALPFNLRGVQGDNPANVPDDDQWWFFNDSGFEIPAWGLFVIEDLKGTYPTNLQVWARRVQYRAKRPSSTFRQKFGVNGPLAVADQTYGRFQKPRGPQASDFLVGYSGTDPTAGDCYGPQVDSFVPLKNYPKCLHVVGVYDAPLKLMLATLGVITECVGKPNASIAANALGTINLYSGSLTSGDLTTLSVISSLTISARNLGPAVTTSNYVALGWLNGCPVFNKLCNS